MHIFDLFSDMKPLERYAIQGSKSHHGRIVTSSFLPVFNQPLTVKRQCLWNFFIGYIRNDTVLNSKCFETSPRWMQKMQDIIQDVPFTHVLKFILLAVKFREIKLMKFVGIVGYIIC